MLAKHRRRDQLVAMSAMFGFLIRRCQVLEQMKLEILNLGEPLAAYWAFEPWRRVVDEGVVVKAPQACH